MKKRSLIPVLSLVLVLGACGSGEKKEPDNKPDVPTVSDEIHYQGRIDYSNANTPMLIWQGTTVETEFTGDSLQVGFSKVKGQVYFDVDIDGQTSMIKAENGWIDIPVAAGNDTHTVKLFKRSEADVGYIGFLGFKTKPEGSSDTVTTLNIPDLSNATPDASLKILFFGDSITAGACNEDGGEDQWEDYSTHNNALSYGAMTAKVLDAEYRNISVSGMGITMGYNTLLFEQVWNRVYPDPSSDVADVSLWQPDVIFTNFGENDDSYSSSQNLDFPSNFTSKYVSVVRKIREAYPDSTIVVLRGGMYGGSQSQRLRGPWEDTVNTLEASDNNIKHFVFDHWSSLHPRVSDHETLSQELVTWAKANLSL